MLRATKIGLTLRVVGDSTDADRTMGLRPAAIRTCATAVGAGALDPVLKSVGISEGYYLLFAAPYVLTLGVLIATSSPMRAMTGAPEELRITK